MYISARVDFAISKTKRVYEGFILSQTSMSI